MLSFTAPYERAYKELLHRFKFRGETNLSRGIASLMLLNGFHKEMEIDFLVPVPQGPLKKQVRGFNQSEKIAFYLGRFLGKDVRKVLGRKDHPALSQTDGKMRDDRVRGTMYLMEEIVGKKILLIDDVFTTGATMRECMRTLENGKAKNISGMFFLKKERRMPFNGQMGL